MNRRFRTAIATLIAALSIAVAIAAAPANAAVGSMSASLSISDSGTSICNVVVSGVVRTSTSNEAWALYLNNWIHIRLWGDDLFSDDNLYQEPSPSSIHYQIRSDGLYFYVSYNVYCAMLNEDTKQADDHDEIYAGVRLRAYGSGSTIRSAESNRVYGYFNGNL